MTDLTNRQRAAAVLAQLDQGRAAAILARMTDVEAVQLATELALLPPLSQEALEGVVESLTSRLQDFNTRQGGSAVAKRLLAARLGDKRADEIMEEVDESAEPRPMAFLGAIQAPMLARTIRNEHPQLIAVIMAHLRHAHAASVLSGLEPGMRTEIVRRLASMNSLPPIVLQRLNGVLEDALTGLAGARSEEVDGVEALAQIVTSASRETERQLLVDLEQHDPELAQQVRDRLFRFEDLVALEAPALQTVLQAVPPATVVLALKGKSDDVVEHVLGVMSARRNAEVRDELLMLPPQRLSVVLDAESELLRAAAQLIDSGVIAAGRAGDDLVV